MFSIKSSFADCLECELYDSYSCILETNCKNDLGNVDVIFVAENPGKDEVSHNPPVPLIGKAGRVFRKYFKMFDLNKQNYLLTNVVLCQTLDKDGNTGNPSNETVERCKVNCFNIINECKPKLIVLMGGSAGRAFGLIKKGEMITNIRGNMYKWNGYDVLLTLHPSYILRNRDDEDKFANDLKRVPELLGQTSVKNVTENYTSDKTGVYYYKIPDKFYTNDYKLVDVQFLNRSNEVLYIFRDRDNKKIYHKEGDDYVCYQYNNEKNAKLTMPYDELNQIKIPYRARTTLDPKITYEGDVKITVKHAQDYYLQKKEEECIVDLNVLYLDIETYSDTKGHSTVEAANDIICIIGYHYNGKNVSYVLDPAVLKINKEVTIDYAIVCKSEKDLINRFIEDVKRLDPDIITGWYADGFDIPYIVNRCKKIGLKPESLSKFGEVDIDAFRGKAHIAGVVVTDLLFLYKSFTFGNRESYSLDYIANLELGEGKLGKGYNFSDMFRESPDESIKYNFQDYILLPKLNDKLKHIALQDELRKICKTCFDTVKSSMGQLDPLLISFLKENGIASKNANIGEKGGKFEGAFVKEPIVGTHEYIVDFDFSSLYPSLILSYNVGVNTFVMKFEDYTMGYDFCYNKDNLPEKINMILDPVFSKKEVEIDKNDLIKIAEDENLICTINGCFFKAHESEMSYYSQILDFLLKSRKSYKNKMFEAKQAKDMVNLQLYDMKQQVYKIIANSLYGILGNNAFRFFDMDCARSITLSGQESIKTCIVEANNYVESFKTKEYVKPEVLTKEEIFTENMHRETRNVITGDTDSIFLTYSKLIERGTPEEDAVKKVLEWNEEVHIFLNDTIIPEIVTRHNITKKVNRLELKNELVIKRGLFLAKKRYALHVISQEGRKTDEIKPMGLEVRRSDFPSLTKQKLNELLELILKSKEISLKSIYEYVEENKKLLVDEIAKGSKTIARPVSFTKKVEEYKVIPQGVKGMVNFNLLEYHAFDVGSRGYLFKLKGIDLEKAPMEVQKNYDKYFTAKGKSIAEIVIPETELRLPPYYIMDKKAILEFAWIDRYSQLLEPLLPREEVLKW